MADEWDEPTHVGFEVEEDPTPIERPRCQMPTCGRPVLVVYGERLPQPPPYPTECMVTSDGTFKFCITFHWWIFDQEAAIRRGPRAR